KSFYEQARLVQTKKNTIVYHGYDTSKTYPFRDNPEPLTAPLLALPGRIITRKGHRYAIEAITQVNQYYPKASLHIYGEGPEENALKEIVKARKLENTVFFHGYVENIIEELNRYDIVIIPSLWEPFGLVFLDGFAANVPIVAFDLPAGNELI